MSNKKKEIFKRDLVRIILKNKEDLEYVGILIDIKEHGKKTILCFENLIATSGKSNKNPTHRYYDSVGFLFDGQTKTKEKVFDRRKMKIEVVDRTYENKSLPLSLKKNKKKIEAQEELGMESLPTNKIKNVPIDYSCLLNRNLLEED